MWLNIVLIELILWFWFVSERVFVQVVISPIPIRVIIGIRVIDSFPFKYPLQHNDTVGNQIRIQVFVIDGCDNLLEPSRPPINNTARD